MRFTPEPHIQRLRLPGRSPQTTFPRHPSWQYLDVIDVASSRTVAKHCRNSDQDNGSIDGRLGGANQITEPDDRPAIGDVVQAKIFARFRINR